MWLPKITNPWNIAAIENKQLFLTRLIEWLPEDCIWDVAGYELDVLEPYRTSPKQQLWRVMLDFALGQSKGFYVKIDSSSKKALGGIISQGIHENIERQFLFSRR